MSAEMIEGGSFVDLPKRKLKRETGSFYGFQAAKDEAGTLVQLSTFSDGRSEQAQVLRYADGHYETRGDAEFASTRLWGEQLFSQGGPVLVIASDQLSAMSVHQAKGGGIAVVSLPQGPTSAKKAIASAQKRGFLGKFKEVIYLPERSEAGEKSEKEIIPLFKGGRLKIAHLPGKDASDVYVNGSEKTLTGAIWNAQPNRPQQIVTVTDVKADVMKPIEMGMPWCFDVMNDWDFGRRTKEITGFGAGTGVGKTTLLSQFIQHDLWVLGLPVAAYMLESDAQALTRGIAGFHVGKNFMVPINHRLCDYTEEELQAAIDDLETKPFLMFDAHGAGDWESVEIAIRSNAAEGFKIHYLDHLTALIEDESKEKEELQALMKKLAGLAIELDIWIGYVSHLSTPEGKSHEEGGHVSVKHFKGSRAIGFWSHTMYGLERNQQAEEKKQRQTTKVRCLKCRVNGQATGETFELFYDGKRLVNKPESHGSLFDARPATEVSAEEEDPM